MKKYSPFIRKASNIQELCFIGRRYSTRLPLFEIDVVKEISLDVSLYVLFSNNLLDDYEFFIEFSNLSYFDKTIARCIKISCEDNPNKPAIYVVLEGTHYAKYSFSYFSID
ncbi:hypothetical protein [Liberiplasma polymorphum]|uniref:hypothetical protein n=1 Tax=Liberiplasma polymorphum TaxID=3374570 RepID=UPI003770EC07